MDKYTFDDNPQAIFNPVDIVEKINDCPKIAVSVFANNLIENGNYLNSRVSQCVHAKIIEKWFLHEEKGGE